MPPEEMKKAVKHRLIDLGMTQRQLCDEVTARTGRFCDNATIKRVLDGTTKRTPIREAIREILDLPEEYQTQCPLRRTAKKKTMQRHGKRRTELHK